MNLPIHHFPLLSPNVSLFLSPQTNPSENHALSLSPLYKAFSLSSSSPPLLSSLSFSLSVMASKGLKQRVRIDEPEVRNTRAGDRTRRQGKAAMAKRGLRSLSIAVLLPLSLAVFSIYIGSSHGNGSSPKTFWFPPVWALHLTRIASTIFMSLSAWLVWADGVFHKKPTAFSLYLLCLGLSLFWYPLVFRWGFTRVGLLLGLGEFGAVMKCYRIFKEDNPIAGDLVKPCLASAAFMAVVNLKLLFM